MGWRDAPPAAPATASPAPAAPAADDDPFSALVKKSDVPAAAGSSPAASPMSGDDPFSQLVRQTQGAPDPVPDGMLPSYYDKSVKPITPGYGLQEPGKNYDPTNDPASVAAGNVVNGIPIIGPAIFDVVNRGVAKLKTLTQGGTFEGNLKAIEDSFEEGNQKHPTAAMVGNVAGQAAGYGLAAAAAPAAFGIGASSLPAAMGVSGATNALVSAGDAAVRGEDPTTAGVVGGVIGAVAPGVSAAFQKLIRPMVDPYIAKLAKLATEKFNIPISAGQISANPMIKMTGSVSEKLPGTGGTAAKAARQKAFNGAVAGEMGETADALTPEVMASARKRIGGMFDNAANQTPTIGADTQFGNDLMAIVKDINDPVDRALTADERKIVEKQIGRVLELFKKSSNGTITGQQYQQLTRMGTPLDKAVKSGNPNIAFYASQIKDALDGALERFAPPEALSELRTARYQWKVMKTVENLAEKAPAGDISAPNLMQEVRNRFPNMAYEEVGRSPLVDLARIGQQFLKEPGSSNTSERAAILHAFEMLGGAAGMHLLLANPVLTTVGAAAPIIAGRITGTILRAKPVVNTLIRSSLRTTQGPVARSIPPAVQAIGQGPVKNALAAAYGQSDTRSAQ